ncbi:MAG: DUF2304 family protein [Patescibacteria group bacterium]
MLLIQIFIVVFALFAIVRASMQFHQGRVTRFWLVFWLLFWLVLCLVVLLPQTTQTLASVLGVGRGVDLAIYVSIILLFYLVYRVFVKLEDIENQITKLVRSVALKDLDEE